MRLRLALSFAAATWLAPALADSPADRWNLTELYPSVEAWNADTVKLEAQMNAFADCKGHLGDNAARFRKCLDLQADMNKRYARLYVYSSETLAEDTGGSPEPRAPAKGRDPWHQAQ
jgi:oligoendopeptidase F